MHKFKVFFVFYGDDYLFKFRLSFTNSVAYFHKVVTISPQSHPKAREKSRPSYAGRASFICKSHALHMQDARPTYEGRDFSLDF